MFLVLTITAVLTVWLNHHYQHHQNEQEYLQTLTSVLSQTPDLRYPLSSPDGTGNGMSELLVVGYDYQCRKITSTPLVATLVWRAFFSPGSCGDHRLLGRIEPD